MAQTSRALTSLRTALHAILRTTCKATRAFAPASDKAFFYFCARNQKKARTVLTRGSRCVFPPNEQAIHHRLLQPDGARTAAPQTYAPLLPPFAGALLLVYHPARQPRVRDRMWDGRTLSGYAANLRRGYRLLRTDDRNSPTNLPGAALRGGRHRGATARRDV